MSCALACYLIDECLHKSILAMADVKYANYAIAQSHCKNPHKRILQCKQILHGLFSLNPNPIFLKKFFLFFVFFCVASLSLANSTDSKSHQNHKPPTCFPNSPEADSTKSMDSRSGIDYTTSAKEKDINSDFVFPHAISPQSTYIFGNTKNIIVPKSKEFISTLASEVFTKSGIKLFVDVIDEVSFPSCYPTKQSRKIYQNQVISRLNAPFVIIFLFVQEHKIEILSSQDLHYISSSKSTNQKPTQDTTNTTEAKKEFLSPKKLDSIYFDYIAPLLPHKEEDLTPNRISGVILNGYAEIADRIADTYHFTLENNFPRDEEGVRNYVKFILYVMLFILLGLFAFAYLPKRSKS